MNVAGAMASHAEGVSQDKRLGLGPCLGVLDDELLVDTLLPCLCPEELLVLGTTASGERTKAGFIRLFYS